MNKKKIIILFILSIFLIFSGVIYYNSHNPKIEPINIYIFRGEGCPHCAAEMNYLKGLKNGKYKNMINIIDYEVWENKENQAKINELSSKTGVQINGVPFTVIGNKYFSGYSEGMNEDIEKLIDTELKNTERQSIMDSIK